MKISCPSCSAKYSIADEKVQDRLAKIRCRKCSATIVIDGKVSPANVYTTSGDTDAHEHAADAPAGAEYSVDFGEGDQRNYQLVDLVAAYNSGHVNAETFVWADGFPDWKMIRDVPEVIEAINAAPAAHAHAPAAVAAAPRAAVRTTGRAGAADLFGRIESAGSEEEEVATSAPDGGASAAASPFGAGASAYSAGSTGARNESSVLFSLSALTAGASKPAATAASKPAAVTGEKEDSGLIDLKALTAAATKSDTAAAGPLGAPLAPLGSPLGHPPLGVAAPLGLGSPLGGGASLATAADYSMPQQKSNTGVFILVGFVLFALIIGGALMLKGGDEPAAAAPVATTVATPVIPTTPPTQDELAAKPPATGVAPEGDAPDGGAKTAAKGGARKGGGGAKKGGGSSGPAAAAPAAEAPAAAPPKKKNPCGCASGDLQCNMRCAAGG